MLTLPEAAVLIALKVSGPMTVQSLQTGEVGLDHTTGVGLIAMRLEQAKLILGYGLPRQYGLLAAGDDAVRVWRREAGALVARAWED